MNQILIISLWFLCLSTLLSIGHSYLGANMVDLNSLDSSFIRSVSSPIPALNRKSSLSSFSTSSSSSSSSSSSTSSSSSSLPFHSLRASSSSSSVGLCSRDEDSLCFDDTCGIDVALASADHQNQVCNCVPEDVGYKFSSCDPASRTRSLLYFWKPPATCLNGGSLPPPIHGIPCDLSCYEGQFLNVSSLSCETCPPGAYSAGSGHRWEYWSEWPSQFSTLCVTGDAAQPCQAWQLRGGYADSGDNYNEHYLESALELRVQIFQPSGAVQFRYTVNGDSSDLFYFIVNDVLYIADRAGGPGDQWRTSPLFPLAQGYHSIKWAYRKDRSKSRFEDRVKLSLVALSGTQIDPVRCALCPPGAYSPTSGAAECLPCPANASSGWGAASCAQCDAGEHSYDGGQLCLPLPDCTVYDYSDFPSACTNAAVSHSVQWLDPPACDTSRYASGLPHAAEPDTCGTQCAVGDYMDETLQRCVHCAEGTHGTPQLACEGCAEGSRPSLRVEEITRFPSLEAFPWMRTVCLGDCFAAGKAWRAGGTFLDSGAGNGQDSNSLLRMALTMYYQGSVDLHFSLSCAAPSQFLVYLNDLEVATFPCPITTYSSKSSLLSNNNDLNSNIKNNRKGNSEEIGAIDSYPVVTVSLPIPIGNHSLYLVYHKETPPTVPHRDDRVILYNVTLQGSSLGRTASCTLCPRNTYAAPESLSTCLPCPAGQQSLPGSSSCTPCPENWFSKSGQDCVRCGSNTYSPRGSARCLYDAAQLRITTDSFDNPVEERTFQLQQMTSMGVIGPIADPGHADRAFFLNLDGPSMVGSTCLSKQPDFSPQEEEAAKDEEGEYMATHSCLVTTAHVASFSSSNATDLGSIIAFSYEEGMRPEGLRVINLVANFYSADSLARSSLVVVCDPQASSSFFGLPMLASGDDAAQLYRFEWGSRYGCPLCTAADYASTLSACVDGYRSRHYYWVTRCVPGAALPATVQVACEDVQISQGTEVAIGILIALVVGVFLVALSFLYYRYRHAQSQYEVLVNQNAPPAESGDPVAAREDIQQSEDSP